MLHFHLLTIQALGNKLRNAPVVAFPLIYFSQIVCGARMNRIIRAMRYIPDPLLQPIHHRYTEPNLILNHTISTILKDNYLCLWTFYYNSSKIGSWYCFTLTCNTRDDSSPFGTTIPLFVKSISLTPRRACLCTSSAYSLFSPLTLAVLFIDNLLKTLATTLALPGW